MTDRRVGLVLVSHSRRLGEGVAELARQLSAEVPIEVAAGAEDGSLGTDAVAIGRAIERACGEQGDREALILVDLGSAVLSADAASELLPPGLANRVQVADAPLVEGAVAAVVEAGLGSSLAEVRAAAESAREARKL
ncbi:MAG: dihydroxyacetone kinase phosphoryl donor subunit DhaM [Candidatus Dormibacteraceae bacterium]